MATAAESPRRTLGQWPVRLRAIVGSILITVAAIGWWLDTRVVDDDGFADVVAQASQRAPVRDYIADQATLRLARTSNFVTAARPAVTDALSAAIATKPVEDAIRSFAARAHQQVFEARAARRVDVTPNEPQRPTALDTLEADNCIVNPPATGLALGPPIPRAFAEPRDQRPACVQSGSAGRSTTSTTLVP